MSRGVRVASWQAPLVATGLPDVIPRLRRQILTCESAHVEILCCPEAVVGGLADYSAEPMRHALAASEIERFLTPIASETVASIVGFTELAPDGKLFNSAAILHRGALAGIYRKLHPAIRHSVYEAGSDLAVFRINELTFGILICYDSTFPEHAATLAAQGASVIFIPTNCGLPLDRGGCGLAAEARNSDIRTAQAVSVAVVRADVCGTAGELACHGSSAIVDARGVVSVSAPPFSEALLIAELSV